MGYFPAFENTGIAGTEFGDWMGGWGAMVLAAMFIVIFFYVIVYMLSRALQSEELRRSAVAHMMDALFNALLALVILVVMSAFFSMLTSFFEGAQVQCDIYGTIKLNETVSGPFDVIKCRLMEKASYVSDIYERVYSAAREPFKKLTIMWGLLGIPIYMYGAYIGHSSISPIYTEVESYRLLAHVCVTLLIGINGYIGAVDYVYENMLRMFLPIGIVLRAIPFTRGIGAFFMALAIGFYVIMPFIFFITYPIYVRVPSTYVDISDKSSITFPWPSFAGAVSILTMGPQTQSQSQIFGSMNIQQGASELSELYYGLIIHPIVILSITLIFVRYLTSLFGGESQELYRLAGKVI